MSKLLGILLAIWVVAAPADSPTWAATIALGETTVLAADNSGDGNLLVAYRATLAQPGTLQSLSFYVTSAAGSLRLAVFDATGSGGRPGQLRGETAAFAPVAGWNTHPVIAPATLPAGDYYLAYLPSSSDLHFRSTFGAGTAYWYAYAFGPMPANFSPSPTGVSTTWSLYATVETSPPQPIDGAPGAPSIRLSKLGGVQLEWDAPTTNVDGSPLTDLGTYRVYWGAVQTGCPGPTYQSVPSPKQQPAGGDLIQWLVSGLTWDQEYKFQVTAVDLAGNESPCSITATGKPKY